MEHTFYSLMNFIVSTSKLRVHTNNQAIQGQFQASSNISNVKAPENKNSSFLGQKVGSPSFSGGAKPKPRICSTNLCVISGATFD